MTVSQPLVIDDSDVSDLTKEKKTNNCHVLRHKNSTEQTLGHFIFR